MVNLKKHLILCLSGGIVYCLIELMWRGHTNWTMGLVGGICFVLIGELNELFSFDMSVLLQMFISCNIITLIEFVAGVILNIWLKLNIWDYSMLWGNVLGQVCPQFYIAWFFLSLVAIILDDYLRFWLFGEEKPHYVLISK